MKTRADLRRISISRTLCAAMAVIAAASPLFAQDRPFVFSVMTSSSLMTGRDRPSATR